MTEKMRLDQFLAVNGYADSRARAQALIKAGLVQINGRTARHSSDLCGEADHIDILGEACPYVSRGGLKLEKALRDFGIVPRDYVCSDSGASTGGFTDCLLQQGAKKVFAIDVGHGQLAEKLRADPRVVPMEGTNIRYLRPEELGEALDLSVVDVSFISLQLVLPTIRTLLKPNGQVVCLIKPQFEAGKACVGKKGVVKDPAVHRKVLAEFIAFVRSLNFTVLGLTFSPVPGPEGNIEFLGHLTLADVPGIQPDPAAIVRDAYQTLKG